MFLLLFCFHQYAGRQLLILSVPMSCALLNAEVCSLDANSSLSTLRKVVLSLATESFCGGAGGSGFDPWIRFDETPGLFYLEFFLLQIC